MSKSRGSRGNKGKGKTLRLNTSKPKTKVATYRTPTIGSTSMVKKSSSISKKKPPVAPQVYYSKKAWDKLWYAVEKVATEVGWLGLVDEYDDNSYVITDVFFPKQVVTGTTTEMEPEALIELTMQLLDQGIDTEKLRYWGHSHVNMGVSPSSTDELQIEEYLEDVDWFIRGIYNKKGDSKVDVYDKRIDMMFQVVDNDLLIEPIDDSDKKEVDELLTKNVSKPVNRFQNTHSNQRGGSIWPEKHSYNQGGNYLGAGAPYRRGEEHNLAVQNIGETSVQSVTLNPRATPYSADEIELLLAHAEKNPDLLDDPQLMAAALADPFFVTE